MALPPISDRCVGQDDSCEESHYSMRNNMLFTAHECLNWTYRAAFHTHLGRSMWSHIHTCKICHGKMKLDGCARTCEVYHQILKIESLSLKVQFTAGITDRLSDFCNDIL